MQMQKNKLPKLFYSLLIQYFIDCGVYLLCSKACVERHSPKYEKELLLFDDFRNLNERKKIYI